MPEHEIVKIGKRGQITIPSEIRKKGRFTRGEYLEIINLDGSLLISRIRKRGNILLALKLLGKKFEEKGYTEEDILKYAKKIRKEVHAKWKKKYS